MHMNRSSLLIAALILITAACTGPAAAAYAHNESIWTSSGNQLLVETFMDNIVTASHYPGYYYLEVKGYSAVPVITAFTNSYNLNSAKV